MKKNPLLEHTIERNLVLNSADPVDAAVAARHLEAMFREVNRFGRIFELSRHGRVVAQMVPANFALSESHV